MSRFPIGAAATLEELEGAAPYALLARLREREPVSWLPALGGWLVTRRDLALAVMRDAEAFTVEDPRFTTARVVGPSMLSLDGAAHSRHRAPFVAPFRLGEVRRALGPAVQEEVERLIEALAPAGRAELRRAFAGPLATAVVTRALGLEGAAVPTVLGWYDAIVGAVTDLTAGRPAAPAAREAVAALGAAVHGEAAADAPADALGDAVHGEAAADAPADALGDAVHGGRAGSRCGRRGGPALGGAGADLAADEVTSNAAVLLFGGIETTEGMIANALAHLLADPEALALVRADPAAVPGAVEESLRLEPAAAVVDRYATADVSLGGAEIAAGDLVRVSITAANRDPAVFPDPDRFDPRRANSGRHLAFAAGPHVCLGMHLARQEAHVAIAALLDRLPGLRLAGHGPPPVTGLVFRKPRALDVVWDA